MRDPEWILARVQARYSWVSTETGYLVASRYFFEDDAIAGDKGFHPAEAERREDGVQFTHFYNVPADVFGAQEGDVTGHGRDFSTFRTD